MTPDDLRALRAVLDCGSHDGMAKSAVWHAAFGECDACLTLLLKAALAQRVEGLPAKGRSVALRRASNKLSWWGKDELLAALTGGAK